MRKVYTVLLEWFAGGEFFTNCTVIILIVCHICQLYINISTINLNIFI